jgi:D-alanyl-D-alanine carboxypeptidase
MKRLFVLLVTALSVVQLSCRNGVEYDVPPYVEFFTQNMRNKLEHAADSVFMRVNTPGMLAYFSDSTGSNYVLRRGVSNIVTNEYMSTSNYFRIASNTKTFTGLAVLILVDEGLINLDSSISYYLPEKNIPNGYSIKVRMLGNMTSGLYNYSDDEDLWTSFQAGNFQQTYPPDSLLAIAFRHPPNFPPGTSYEYCNTGIVLLGLLMEKVTGKSCAQIFQEKIFQPANMNDTFWPETVYLLSPYTHGYTSAYGPVMDATNWNPSWGYTAGILISNFYDMSRWAKIVASGSMLSERMKAERFNWVYDHYGFCVMKAGDWVGHPGTMFGYNSHVFYNTVKHISMVILTNTDSGTPVENFSEAFRNILDK